MAKGTKESPTGTTGGTAVVEPEEEFLEVSVIEPEDEALLGAAIEEEPVRGADEGEDEGEPEKKVEAKKQVEAKPVEEKPKPEPEAKGAPKAAPKPEAKVEAEQRPLTPLERRERDKRKDYTRKWEAALEEQERLRARITQLQGEVKVPPVVVPPERLQALKAKLKDVAELETVAEVAVQEAAHLIGERDQQWQQELGRMQLLNRINLSWLNAKIVYPYFHQVLEQSGLLAEIAERPDGSYGNAYLARRIYLSADPGEEAYQLALGRMAHEGRLKDEEPTPVPAPPVAVAAPPIAEAKPAEDKEAEAERRGARRVIEAVEANAKRPIGIAGLKSAGSAKTRWSKTELDALGRANPQARERIFQRFPELERWYLSD